MSTAPAVVHIDGAARGNPGPAAYAFTIVAPGQPIIEEYGRLGSTTNNIAEYTALIRALMKAAELSLSRLDIHSDSELLVKQMNGEYRVKNPELKDLYDEAQALMRGFAAVHIRHVRREHNKRADQLCNIALDGDKPRRADKPDAADSGAHLSTGDVRDECITCLTIAKNVWKTNDPEAPTPEQVWEQLWSILEDGGVLKKAKRKK
jgi:ribonuclease HI